MKQKSMNCLPILVLSLAFGLSACGKGSNAKPAKASPSLGVAADTLDTLFETSCDTKSSDGSIVPSNITANAAYDLSSCQIGSSQRALIQQIGALKVEADCTAQTVRIRNSAGDILAEQNYDKDGNFSATLNLGEQFSEADGCPVNLQGLATGKVSCDSENRVSNIDMNTAYTLSQVKDDSTDGTVAPAGVSSVTANSELLAMNDEGRDHDRDGDRDRDHDRDHDHDGKFMSGGKTFAPAVISKGKVMPISGQSEGKGKVFESKGVQTKGVLSKGKVESAQQGMTKGGKVMFGGERGDFGGRHIPHERVGSCMNFNPCTFNTHASLSCAQPAAASAPAAQPAAAPATTQPAAAPAAVVEQPAVAPAAQPAAQPQR